MADPATPDPGGFLNDYLQYVEDAWTRGPEALKEYAQLTKDTWDAYTASQAKRFETLPADQQLKFMNSGLDGAVVFLFLTIVSRLTLTRVIEPYIISHAGHHQVQDKSIPMTFQQAKWIFTSFTLFAIWHANSHMLFDFGPIADLGVLLGNLAIASLINWRLTLSPGACFLNILVVPALVLAPVPLTVAVMQQGPFITDPAMFQYFLGLITVMTSIYFIFEAPPTIVMHKSPSGQIVPKSFNYALRDELVEMWQGNWRENVKNAPGCVARKIVRGPGDVCRGAAKKSGRALSACGRKIKGFVDGQRRRGQSVHRSSPGTNTYEPEQIGLFTGIIYFFLGIIYGIRDLLLWLLSFLPFCGGLAPSDGGGGGCNAVALTGSCGARRPPSPRPHGHTPKLSNRVSRARRCDDD